MSTKTTVNPYEILQQRRKLKNWKKTTPIECMKILKKVRDMALENQMLIATEFPRTLIYVANRTRDSENQDTKKMNKMCRFLAKQYKKQLGVQDKKQQTQNKPAKQQTTSTKQSQNKIQEEKKD